MKHVMEEISAQEIRTIREMLGLTQAEAGEIIGGGPRAFTKYEAGTVKPAASVINLLKLLEADPSGIQTLRPDRLRPIPNVPNSPFEVSLDHVSVLGERMLPELAERLLNAEASAYDLPSPVIHVAKNIYAADGGEDARITWEDGPSQTWFLPSRACQFQLKSGTIGPAAAGKEALKDMVGPFVQQGGNYIMLCTHPYDQKATQARENRTRQALREAGLTISDDQVQFRSAEQIANWVNHHPAVAVWLKEKTQPGTVGPFRSWVHWSGGAEHDSFPWVEDERLPELKQRLLQLISQPHGVARVVGLSGVGKTRLVMEALGPAAEGEESGYDLSTLVMYTSQQEIGSVVQTLADIGQPAIVVVDDCALPTHRTLSNVVQRQGSRLSLLTIDDEVPVGTLDDSTIKVDHAPSSVTETIIDQALPGLPSEDQRRLSRFSRGFPKIATRLSLIWPRSEPVVNATDDDLVDAFVLGRRPRNPELLLQSAELLSVFDLVGVESSEGGHFAEIAGLGHNLDADSFRLAVKDLADRGVVQRRGRLGRLQPLPIALRLAERQWRRWTPERWDQVLAGSVSPDLKVASARQLTLLNETSLAGEIVRHVCRHGGPLDSAEGISQVGHCEILSYLAEVDAETVARQLERSLNEIEDLALLPSQIRRHLRWALSKIAFLPETFEEGARLLLRLATAENEGSASNSHGGFPGLFPVFLGDTAAEGRARLELLDELKHEAIKSGCTGMQLMVVKALSAGIETNHFSRMSGPEVHGARPALQSWVPATQREVNEYVGSCLTRLAEFARQSDEAGTLARAELGISLRGLVRHGFMDAVAEAVRRVNRDVGFWSQALRSLMVLLSYDAEKLSPDVIERVQTLVDELQPQSIDLRVQALVTELAWPTETTVGEVDITKQWERRTEAVRNLASELIDRPSELAKLLPQMSGGRQAMMYVLGQAIARLSDPPLEWLEPITLAVVQVPQAERNFELLAGYVAGLAERDPNFPGGFKEELLRSPELSPAFPLISARLGITLPDIDLAVSAVKEGALFPRQFITWSYGGVLSEVPTPAVATLIDAILGPDTDGFEVALELVHMYAFGQKEKLEGLRPQILKLAEQASYSHVVSDWVMTEHHFEEVIGWVLDKGREDEDARAVALIVARGLVDSESFHEDRLLKMVVPTLLREFPEISWPLISQAIVSGGKQALRLQWMMGDAFSYDHEPNSLILNLPEDVLFAWCHATPDHGPAFAGAVLPVITTRDPQATERELHPSTARLIDEFGERNDVQQEIEANIHSFGWMGSPTIYYQVYDAPIRGLLQHNKPAVRRWARAMLRRLDETVQQERTREQEREARWE